MRRDAGRGWRWLHLQRTGCRAVSLPSTHHCAAARTAGADMRNLHFLDLPFYQTGRQRKGCWDCLGPGCGGALGASAPRCALCPLLSQAVHLVLPNTPPALSSCPILLPAGKVVKEPLSQRDVDIVADLFEAVGWVAGPWRGSRWHGPTVPPAGSHARPARPAARLHIQNARPAPAARLHIQNARPAPPCLCPRTALTRSMRQGTCLTHMARTASACRSDAVWRRQWGLLWSAADLSMRWGVIGL